MSDFWDREAVERRHIEWMALPPVRLHINELIGGDGEPRWPIEWLEWWLRGRKFERALSVGCGTGNLDRQLVARGLCQRVDAFDGSLTSLHIARETAKQAGLSDRVRYFASDFSHTQFPRRTYDIVFFNQSAHHIERLERFFMRLLDAVKPDGLVYLDEYIGPSRFDWSEALLAPQQAVYASLPAALRTSDRLELPIQHDDPTEAVRSSQIESQLKTGFDIVARRPYGGTLLAVVLPQLRLDIITDAELAAIIAREREWLAAGMPSFYAVIVAQPKPGIRRALGRMRYSAARLTRWIRAQWIRFRARP